MQETMIQTKVNYTLEYEGKFLIIENVPARVCLETGEQFFSPETVEHLHELVKSDRKPIKIIDTPVYAYV